MLIQEKVHQAIAILREMGIDCWLTFTRESQINGDPILPLILGSAVTWHSAFIICRSGETHAIVGQYDKPTVEDTGAWGQVNGFIKSFKEPLQQLLQRVNPRHIAINYSREGEICDGLTYGMYLTLYDALQEIDMADRLISAEKIIAALRSRKSATEIERLRQAIAHTEQIFAQTAEFIRPGVTEKEIAAYMQQQVHRRGVDFAWEAHTCPAVFTGPDTAQAHYAPTSRIVEKGHLVTIDFGVKYQDYCADLQRTFYVLRQGETAPPAIVQQGFATIVRSIEAARQAMKPGVCGLDIDAIARGVVVGDGYEEFPHAVGHQVGRYAHDGMMLLAPAWPKYAGRPFHALESGMVFTLEPRLTVPKHGIISIEEMVMVTESGAEFLSTPQRELLIR